MSVSIYQNKVAKLTAEVASLSKKLAAERDKEAKKSKEITRAERSITKSTSQSSLRTKKARADRLRQELAKIQKNASYLQDKIARKSRELHVAQQRLHKEEDRQDKMRRTEELRHQKALTQEVRTRRHIQALQDRLSMEFPHYETVRDGEVDDQYDIFISHASQDKEDFVEPLAGLLQGMGFRVWYDEFVLKVGDSLRRSIDKGIARSAYGLVVLSPHFFAKAWPQHELDGLTAREIAGRKKLILPVWHNVSHKDVLEYSPPLADKIALDTQKMTLEEIAEAIAEVLPGGIDPEVEDRIDAEEVRKAIESVNEARRLESLIQSVYASLAIEDPTVTLEEVRRVVLRESA
jgi:hypothetical protein